MRRKVSYYVDRKVRSGGLGHQEKENIRGRAQPQRHFTEASVANRQSDTLNNMEGAREGIWQIQAKMLFREEPAKKKTSPPIIFFEYSYPQINGLESQHIRSLNCLSSAPSHILPNLHALSTTSVTCPG